MRTCRATIGAGMCQNTYLPPSPRLSPLGPQTPRVGPGPRRRTCPSGFAGRALSKCAATREDRVRPALHCSAACRARVCHPPTPGCTAVSDSGAPPRAVRLTYNSWRACLAALPVPLGRVDFARNEMVLGGARSSRSAHSQIRTALYLLLLVPRPLPARLVQASAHDAGLALSTANRSSRGARDRVCSNQTAMSSPSAPQMHPIGGPWRGAVDAEPPRHSVCADRRVPLRSRPMECSAVLGTAPVTPRVCVLPFRRRGTRSWRLGARRVSGWALQSPRAPVISAIDAPARRREA
jgi:hypothetical protein